MSVQEKPLFRFDNPVDPSPEELTTWAYHPESVPIEMMPVDWDLLVAGDVLAPTLFDLAMDARCPARRFALHCLYIYAADGFRPNATSLRKRRLRKYIERAEELGDETMSTGAHNCRVLMTRPEMYDHQEWMEGGLVRHPRRLGLFERRTDRR